MGINFIVIVENSRHISLQEFKAALLEHPLGRLAWNSFPDKEEDDEYTPWREFEWEHKTYFTWVFAPRLSTFNIYEFNEEEDEPDEYMITFLKIMLLAEQIAGGPVHIENDVILVSHPDEAHEASGFPFWIPTKLDSYLENWREFAQLEAEPAIIF